MGYTVRLRDLAPYVEGTNGHGGQSRWDRLVLILFEEPGRPWSCAEMADRLYADSPDGGPLFAADCVRQMLHAYRHRLPHRRRNTLPPGWRLTRHGQLLSLEPIEPAYAVAAA